MSDDVVLNKISSIERCLNRITAEYNGKEGQFRTNLTVQDSILLNLQRACEASIDLANYPIKKISWVHPRIAAKVLRYSCKRTLLTHCFLIK